MELELIQIEPTRRCNFSCPHCTRHLDYEVGIGPDIKLNTLTSILDQFDKIDTIKLNILLAPSFRQPKQRS